MAASSLMTGKEEEKGPGRDNQMGKEPNPAGLEAGGQHHMTGVSGERRSPPVDETGVGRKETTACPMEGAIGSQPPEERGGTDQMAF